MVFENYSLSSSTLSCKNDMRHSRKCTKKPKPIRLFNQIYNDKNTKYKMYVDIMMVICIKQHLRNIWSRAYSRKKRHDWEFSEKGQKRARCIKFENIFKNGCLMRGTIACMKQLEYALFEAQFMKQLSNTDAELKKCVPYKKKRVYP